ncbi:hypothetical protein M3Y98_00057700 [Aphelenchoides besseyi]|nr:hypothetical protein M3Y98_00057700 [Aphelenchoides besseyi]
MKRVSGWSALTLLLCILLCLNGMQLYDVRNSAVDLDAGISANKPLDEAKQQIRRDVEMLWTTRANPPNFTKEEVPKYNAEQFDQFKSYVYFTRTILLLCLDEDGVGRYTRNCKGPADHRTRTEHLKCSKCINLDLLSFWCNRTQDNFCRSVSPQGIVYFTALGSFYNAEEMRRLYRELVA